MTFLRVSLFLLLAAGASAGTLPGFRVEKVADVPGFVSSVVVDSAGVVYATTTDGWIHRIEGGTSVPVASLPTKAGGNGGLLGMALLDDATAVVHYTTWSGEKVLDDVVSTVDLATGAEQVLKAFPGDIEFRERGVSDEHHGGNLTVAPDGTIYVGIGEYGAHAIAQKPEWNAGKIWRIDREGNATKYAQGMRNPYDLAWDPQLQRVVVGDNGANGGDKLHVIESGVDCGWPVVRPVSVAPDYVFPSTVAPTGIARMTGANPMIRRGYLMAAFVTRSLYYFPDVAARPIPDPVPVVDDFTDYLIDVTEAPGGEIYLATASFLGSAIQRLHVPPRGDCNGDGLTNSLDILPMFHEIGDGDGHPMITAQDGDYAGSWGCDANADSRIDAGDLDTLVGMISSRRRAVRR
ncbi:MAG TPA: PQQ-dependent sugar dehydrogenase [Thermoanaerobaculia bacterium]